MHRSSVAHNPKRRLSLALRHRRRKRGRNRKAIMTRVLAARYAALLRFEIDSPTSFPLDACRSAEVFAQHLRATWGAADANHDPFQEVSSESSTAYRGVGMGECPCGWRNRTLILLDVRGDGCPKWSGYSIFLGRPGRRSVDFRYSCFEACSIHCSDPNRFPGVTRRRCKPLRQMRSER